MAIVIFIFFPVTALLPLFFKQVKQVRLMALVMGIVSSLITFLFLIKPLFSKQAFILGNVLRIDRFSAFMGILIILLYFFTVIVSHRYIKEENHEKILDLKQIRLYFLLLPIFALAMLTVVMVDNLGLLWLALEITTLATTPLVALYRKDGSLEAAWKYIILCSLGISLGLLAVLFISYAGINSNLSPFDSFSLRMLTMNALKMPPAIMQWAFLFAFIGLGTKIGFFPMHTWLPDAHGRTPSPISAMLSGILLNVAFYSLMRIKFITDIALRSSEWTNNLFLAFGVISLVASAFFLYIQHNYKRMLAYSSMEHMGILAIAVGLGPLGMVPALMHMFAHTLSKSLLFFGSGEILLATKTAKIHNVKNLIHTIPVTGTLFILGMFSLLAVPPFAAFSSEILILAAIVNKGHLVIFFLMLLALALVCVSLFRHTFRMFCLHQTDDNHQGDDYQIEKKFTEKFNLTHLVMVVEIVLLAISGIFMLTPEGFNFFSGIAQSIFL
ncbi:hydrogenase 4 subunit F [Candidatus Peregrinibacteria bacterium]|nr:hydrogenase 4 subunit F [Candidatus Peregrinibacteria bacterium]